MTGVTIGHVVGYILTNGDAARINNQREESMAGYNLARTGDHYPAVIVRTFEASPGACNLKVFLDGEDSYWATSRCLGDSPGNWYWLTGEADYVH